MPDGMNDVRGAGSKFDNRLFDILLLGVLAASGLTYYWLSTHGTWNPQYDQVPRVLDTGHFFLAQARGILHARLWVHPSQTAYDCFIHDGKCYGYFGLTPSILRLPFLSVLDHYNNGFTPVYITAGLTLATGSSLASLRHLLSRIHMTRGATYVVALTTLGLGAGSVLTQLTQPDVYNEAIVWAVAFLALGLYCFIRWWEDQRSRWYVILLVSLTLATNARPTAIPFAFVIGCGVGYRLWQRRRVGPSDWTKPLLLTGALILVPIATAIGVFLIKFGQPIPSYLLDQQIAGRHATPRWIKIRKIDHNDLTGPKFMITALFAYLRPDALDFTRSFPWVYYRFRTTFAYTGFGPARITYIGLSPGSLYSGTVTSLTVAMPLSFLVAVAATGSRLARSGGVRLRHLRSSLASLASWRVIVLVASVASWCVVLFGVAVEARFLADAYPLVALLLLLGLPSLATRFDRGGRLFKAGVTMIVLMAVSWQLLVNVGLAWRYPGA